MWLKKHDTRVMSHNKIIINYLLWQCHISFWSFFMSVKLMDTIKFLSVGTCIQSWRNMPKFQTKLPKWECEFRVNTNNTLALRWMDSKQVLVLSNCQPSESVLENCKQKDGKKIPVKCPCTIALYNKIMGGVDLSDQNVNCYDFNHKSTKFWKKCSINYWW